MPLQNKLINAEHNKLITPKQQESASVEDDIEPFVKFIVSLITK